MCKCIIEIQETIPKETRVYKGKKILQAKLKGVFSPISGNKLSMLTTQPLELTLEGRKTPLKTNIQHRYCPWCGEDQRTNPEN